VLVRVATSNSLRGECDIRRRDLDLITFHTFSCSGRGIDGLLAHGGTWDASPGRREDGGGGGGGAMHAPQLLNKRLSSPLTLR